MEGATGVGWGGHTRPQEGDAVRVRNCLACRGRGRREWAGVSQLTDWPLQTCPQSVKWAYAHQVPICFLKRLAYPD